MFYMCSKFKRQHVCNRSFTDVFAEKGNVKIYNAEARTFALDIQHWIKPLTQLLAEYVTMHGTESPSTLVTRTRSRISTE